MPCWRLPVIDQGARACREAFAAKLIEVRYEDFCSDVHGTLGTILHRLDLEADSFPFRRCPATLSSRNSYWLARASPHELAGISQIQSAQLTRYGYPVA